MEEEKSWKVSQEAELCILKGDMQSGQTGIHTTGRIPGSGHGVSEGTACESRTCSTDGVAGEGHGPTGAPAQRWRPS